MQEPTFYILGDRVMGDSVKFDRHRTLKWGGGKPRRLKGEGLNFLRN